MPLTLDDTKRYKHCRHLRLDDFEKLDALQDNPATEVLTLYHFHRIDCLDLSPVASLRNLKAISMATTLTWDGTNRHLLVDSFAPLALLPKLEMIQILGVVPRKDRLKPLGAIKSLQKMSIGNTNFYQLEDFAMLSRALPSLEGIAPISEMNFVSVCSKCKTERMLHLNGAKPRSRRYVCPKCNMRLILRHLHRWNDAGGQPSYDDLEDITPGALLEIFGNPQAPVI